MKNYLEIYKFQEGGQAPAPAQDPQAEMAGMIQEILSTGNCDMAMQLIQMLAQEMGIQAGAPAQAEQPVFKKGGAIVKKKMAYGAKMKKS